MFECSLILTESSLFLIEFSLISDINKDVKQITTSNQHYSLCQQDFSSKSSGMSSDTVCNPVHEKGSDSWSC